MKKRAGRRQKQLLKNKEERRRRVKRNRLLASLNQWVDEIFWTYVFYVLVFIGFFLWWQDWGQVHSVYELDYVGGSVFGFIFSFLLSIYDKVDDIRSLKISWSQIPRIKYCEFGILISTVSVCSSFLVWLEFGNAILALLVGFIVLSLVIACVYAKLADSRY